MIKAQEEQVAGHSGWRKGRLGGDGGGVSGDEVGG